VENFRAAIPRSEWDSCELRVRRNVELVLEVLRGTAQRATFFVLGWIAEKDPALVREISAEGHEVASHGYSHDLVSRQTVSEFFADVSHAKAILEDITGKAVIGYRAPSFSIRAEVYPALRRAGYLYDSSIVPTKLNPRYGQVNMGPILAGGYFWFDGIKVFPLPVLKAPLASIPLGGGGYFRFFPYWLFKRLFRSVGTSSGSAIFYAHPWEFDPDQPKVTRASRLSRFRHYHGISSNIDKFRRLLLDFKFTAIGLSPAMRDGLRSHSLDRGADNTIR
jgi:polysaccharide deacetylase family protein (PEP-CTERM system associated)